jgi:hypothetical protein
MQMSESDFRAAYGKLVAATWSDPGLVEKLKSDPHGTLDEYGIETQPGATVRVVEMKPTGKGSFEEQWEDWQEGEKSGTYDLWLPSPPSGVSTSQAAAVDTTCTPCCTCT